MEPEVGWKTLVYGQVQAVQSALRKNARWATAHFYDSTQLHARSLASSTRRDGAAGLGGPQLFHDLKAELGHVNELSQLDAHTLLFPFLEVVRSGDTSGPITAVALTSIDKFISYRLLHAHSPGIQHALAELITAATHCKFEASDSISDEVVLLKILDILKSCVLDHELGAALTDESVCMIMETGLSMCCQMRLSELLRKSAEKTMQALVMTVFSKLKHLPPQDDAATGGTPSDVAQELPHDALSISKPDALSISKPDPDSDPMPPTPPVAGPSRPAEDKPYGLPSITELLRVLVSLLDPNDPTHTDSMRSVALTVLQTAFEVGGSSMVHFKSLRTMASDSLCKHVLELIRAQIGDGGSGGSAMLAACLRFIATVFDTMRSCLRLQLELYLSFLLDRLSVGRKEAENEQDQQTWDADLSVASQPPSNNASPPRDTASPAPFQPKREVLNLETHYLLLEQLCILLKDPSIAPTLWVNYDTRVESEDLLERAIKFLARAVFLGFQSPAPFHPQNKPGVTDGAQTMCLDSLLAFVQGMLVRDGPVAADDRRYAEELAHEKTQKRLLVEGAALFNVKPKKGLAFLEQNGFIYQVDSPMSREAQLARFLKTCVRLDKRVLGDWISTPASIEVLKEYMNLFNWTGKIISDAMRELLESFRLPGEAQPIARITEVFAAAYFNSQDPSADLKVKTQDAAYVLSYSVIMLNTDQHNPQNVKNRMKFEDYKKNMRGVNDGSDFDVEFLQAIYEDIKKREIVLPEEHSGQLGFDYAWRELLKRSETEGQGDLRPAPGSTHDAHIFAVAWKPVISALAHAFRTVQDEASMQSLISGFRQAAELAQRFDLPQVFDYTISVLARITGLMYTSDSDSTAFPTVKVPATEASEAFQVTVSPLSIRFGSHTKAQLAAIVVFNIANANGPAIRTGWIEVFDILTSLFLHSLLPVNFPVGSTIPLKPPQTNASANGRDRAPDSGLLSTLSSYLLSPYAGSQQPDGLGRDLTEEDVDNTLVSIDAVASCRLEELWTSVQQLPAEAVLSIIESIKELAERATSRKTPTLGISTNATSRSQRQLAYDPAVAFLHETMVSIASAASADAQGKIWEPVYDFCAQILNNAAVYSPLLVERAVVGLLKVASDCSAKTNQTDPLFSSLDLLRSLPAAILNSVAEQLVNGIIALIQNHPAAIQTREQWSTVFFFFSSTAHKETAAKPSFELLQTFVYGPEGSEGRKLLTALNFVAFIECVNVFAGVASQKSANDEASISDAAIDRGQKALDMIRDSQAFVDVLIQESSLPFAQAWEVYWIPILSAYAQQSTNSVRKIRQASLSQLQRTLITQELLSNPQVDLLLIFNKIIFPTLDELLKPQVFRRDPVAAGMGETRLRACALLCKIFLHCAATPARVEQGQLVGIWARVLDALDRMMHSGRRDAMYEAVPEQLKNAILVMSAQGILLPPTEPGRTEEQIRLWDTTFSRIDTFLPNLQQELFPQVGALPSKTVVIDYAVHGRTSTPLTSTSPATTSPATLNKRDSSEPLQVAMSGVGL